MQLCVGILHLLLLLNACCSLVSCLYLYMGDTEKKCFLQDLAKEIKVVGEHIAHHVFSVLFIFVNWRWGWYYFQSNVNIASCLYFMWTALYSWIDLLLFTWVDWQLVHPFQIFFPDQGIVCGWCSWKVKVTFDVALKQHKLVPSCSHEKGS